MKNFKKTMNDFMKDESAQGMVEYILILVAVIGFVILLRKKLTSSLETGLGNVDGGISKFEVQE